jgi:Polyketide cyclase / dehydrase and lipid transport
MPSIAETAFIAQPTISVFNAAVDPHLQLTWDAPTLRTVEKLTPGPLARGARYRGDFKGFGRVTYEFAEFEPGRCFQHVARIPMGEMRHRFTFEAAAGGTQLTQQGELRPNIVGRLFAPLVMNMLRKRFRTIAQELDAYLAVAPPAAKATTTGER